MIRNDAFLSGKFLLYPEKYVRSVMTDPVIRFVKKDVLHPVKHIISS